MSCVLFDHSPRSERVEDPATDTSRRDFLRRAGGAAGLGLVHFTILGSLATPAFAETDDDCGAKCPTDQNILDICTCASGDNTTPPRDVCNCGDEEVGGAQDVCECGDETQSDACNCPDDHNDFPSDACDCDRDQSGADVCECNDSSLQVDSCSVCSADEHHHAENDNADYCTCDSEGQSVDACLCWYDGFCSKESRVDACDCDKDASGNVDSCACCYEPSVADDCNCGEDHSGTWCYEESANQNPQHSPKLADWCNCSASQDSTGAADVCDCKEGDSWEPCANEGHWNTQADSCCYATSGSPGSPSPSVDVCKCGADKANGPFDTDYCRPQDPETADYCDCGDDGNNEADVPNCPQD